MMMITCTHRIIITINIYYYDDDFKHISNMPHIFLPRVYSSTRMSSGISSILCTVLTEKGGKVIFFNERSIIYSTK